MLGILSSFPYYYRAEAIKKANGMLFSEEVLFLSFLSFFVSFLLFLLGGGPSLFQKCSFHLQP
jgi:hypothetical protein